MKHRSRRKGAVMVLAASLLSVLLGAGALGLDYGRVALSRWRLQTAVDSAALAGAAELADGLRSEEEKKSRATAIASSVASGNESGTFAVVFPEDEVCQVDGSEVVNLTFARVLGLSSSTVNASAQAGIDGAGAVAGIRPLGIEEPSSGFVYGETYLLKLGPHDDSDPLDPGYNHHGNFHALALGGGGASNYKEKLKYGYDAVIKMGDWLTTEPGNMSGPTSSGISYIMNQDGTSWECYQSNLDSLYESPRLITVPILNGWNGVVGRSDIQVTGFGSFYLEGVAGYGKDSYVTGRFVKKVIPNVSARGGGIFGAYTINLIN